MGWEEDNEDYRRDEIDERHERIRAIRCQCGTDLPGHCPGPMSCPYSSFAHEPEPEKCAECGDDLADGECARCDKDRAEGEAFTAKYGMPWDAAP